MKRDEENAQSLALADHRLSIVPQRRIETNKIGRSKLKTRRIEKKST
jgi:hypothetical protein